jgi:hypothetical protein
MLDKLKRQQLELKAAIHSLSEEKQSLEKKLLITESSILAIEENQKELVKDD